MSKKRGRPKKEDWQKSKRLTIILPAYAYNELKTLAGVLNTTPQKALVKTFKEYLNNDTRTI